ncbi:MAG: hypothetical protein JHC61_16150, partial [Burkholderiaceae bacterium]|nr:hypothetical protein [Burkholderiaceae bacterium]
MSIDAMKWARMADVQKSSSKAILLNLAMLVRYDAQDWTMFASIEYLTQVTHLNRKTVIDALARLRELGVLQDTGRRAGDSHSSIVYRLCPNAVPLIDLTRAPRITARSARQARPTEWNVDQRSIRPAPDQHEDAHAWVLETDPLASYEEGAYASPPGLPLDLPTSTVRSTCTQDGVSSDAPTGDAPILYSSLTIKEPRRTPQTSAYPDQGGFHLARRPRATAGAGATRLPAEWTLPERWRVWTQHERPQWPAEKVDATAATFCAYVRSRPGQAGMSADWFESWRLWVFRERENKGASQPWHTSWSGLVAKGKALGVTQA